MFRWNVASIPRRFYAEVTGYDGTAKKHKIKYLDDGTHEIIALETV